MQQGREPLDRIAAVLFLSAVAPRFDDEHSIAGHAATTQAYQASLDLLRQRRRMPHVEAELHRGGHFVHAL